MPVRIKRGTYKKFKKYAKELSEGEIAFITDRNQIAVGTKKGYTLFDAEAMLEFKEDIGDFRVVGADGNFILNWWDSED